MKKTFSCGQVVEVIMNTSIEVEGNSEEECNQKLIEFINRKMEDVYDILITEDTDDDNIDIICLGMDMESVYGTKNVYVTDDEGVEIYDWNNIS